VPTKHVTVKALVAVLRIVCKDDGNRIAGYGGHTVLVRAAQLNIGAMNSN